MIDNLSTKHKIPVASRHLQREAETALKKAIARALAELIKNSVDSINRGIKHNLRVSPEVHISYQTLLGKTTFRVLDGAEGMSFAKLEEATRHGEAVSGLQEGEKVHGFFGVGLKHVMCSMDDAQTITISDNKISICKFYRTWERELTVQDRPVTQRERDQYGIPTSGTVNIFTLPSDWHKPQSIEKLCAKLDTLYILRMINQNDSYQLILCDEDSHQTRKVEYTEPKCKIFIEKNFFIDTEQVGRLDIITTIKIAENELDDDVNDNSQRGLVLHNEDGVVYDHTLYNYDREYFANRICGYVKIIGFNGLLEKDPTVLDVHRLGLNYQNGFCKELKETILELLRTAVEAEKKTRQSKKEYQSFTEISYETLKELNKIYDEVVGGGGGGITPPTDPKIPEGGIALYPKETTVFERIPKVIYLFLDKERVKDGSRISFTLEDQTGIFKFSETICFKKDDAYKDKRVDSISVKIQGDVVGTQGRLVASCEDCEDTFIDMTVEEDPRQHLETGLGFYPNNSTVADSEERNLSLYVDTSIIKTREIKINSDNPKIVKPITNMANVDKGERYVGDVVHLKIKIIGRGLGKRAIVTATTESVHASTQIEVVKRKLEGIFKDVRLVGDRAPQERASPDGDLEQGYIINIHQNHPIISMYTEADLMNSSAFWAIFADTVQWLATRLIARDWYNKNQVSFDAEPSAEEIEVKRQELEYKFGPRIHTLYRSQAARKKLIERE